VAYRKLFNSFYYFHNALYELITYAAWSGQSSNKSLNAQQWMPAVTYVNHRKTILTCN
jgi:hypothetical protein